NERLLFKSRTPNPEFRLLDPRQPPIETLAESGSQHGLSADDVEPLQSGNSRQQIEIGDVQTVLVRDPVRDRNDDVTDRIGGGGREQLVAKDVFVARVGLADATFVLTERIGEKSRLLSHPRRAAVDIIVTAERLVDQLLEPRHRLRLPSKV